MIRANANVEDMIHVPLPRADPLFGRVDDDDDDDATQQQQQQQQDPDAIPPQDTPLLTHVASSERAWALEIKRAVQELAAETNKNDDDDWDDEEHELLVQAAERITDLEYVEISMASNTVDEGISRITSLVHFRNEYGIKSSVDEGVELFTRLVHELFPRMILSIDNSVTTDFTHFVIDLSKFYPDKLMKDSSDRNWRTFLGAVYYMLQALQPNVKAMRNGAVYIAECDGLGFDNLSIPALKRYFYDLRQFYPCKAADLAWVRLPLVGNMMYTLVRQLMSEQLRRKLRVETYFHDDQGRLDYIFLVPNQEAAVQRQIGNVRRFLTERYHIMQTFRLEPAPDEGL